MADATIGQLPVAQAMSDDALLPLEQQGEAKSIEGKLIKQYARESVAAYVDTAVQSAEQANASKLAAEQAAMEAKAAQEGMDAYTQAAQAAAQKAEQAQTAAEAAQEGAARVQDTVIAALDAATQAASQAAQDALAAKADAQSAVTAAQSAHADAQSAQADAATATEKAAEIVRSAEETARNAAAAQAAQQAAEEAETIVRADADRAHTQADRAKAEADRAAQIVGGDFATRTELQDAVSAHDAAADAHKALLAGKADLVNGKLSAAQLPDGVPDGDIDCGCWDDANPVAAHNADTAAHLLILVDGNVADVADQSANLEEHIGNPLAHQNIDLDGNTN